MNQPESQLRFCQIGVLTRDLAKTVKQFEELYGLKPRAIVEPKYANTCVKGQPREIRIRIAFYALTDQVDLEVIEPLGDNEVYDEWIREKGEGLHHIAFRVPDTNEWLKRLGEKGVTVLQSGERPGVKFTYLDTERFGGVIVELHERS